MSICPNDYPWITCHIKSFIRKRRRIYNNFKKATILHFWNQFNTLRNKITNLTRKSKQEYFDKLEYSLNNKNLNSKLFWNTSKELLKLGKTQQNIHTLSLNTESAETDLQKAKKLNKYFTSQTVVDDNNKTLPRP